MTVERTDGNQIVVLVNIDPLFNAQGKLVGAINCFQDVTERKRVMDALDRSQHDLREQEERWTATYEHAAIGIVELDAEGRFIRVNEAICSIVGGTREELLSWRLQGRTHPEDRDVDDELYRRQVAGDIGFYSIEKRFIRKDGRVIWIAVRSSTVRDATGHFLYGVRVVQDVTERKEAEERQKLLIDELNHRVKNTLATVQSLATQTARGTDSPEAFRKAFEGRLIALSQAHDQLTRRHWKSADLRDIVEGATAPHLGRSQESQDQIAIEGEPITVTPRVALTLGAGAARADHQRLEIRRAVGAGRPHRRALASRAAAGADAACCGSSGASAAGRRSTTPERQGFGTRFIEGSVASELQGKARARLRSRGPHLHAWKFRSMSAAPDVDAHD